jgi:hypothetical protein
MARWLGNDFLTRLFLLLFLLHVLSLIDPIVPGIKKVE